MFMLSLRGIHIVYKQLQSVLQLIVHSAIVHTSVHATIPVREHDMNGLLSHYTAEIPACVHCFFITYSARPIC